MDKSVNNEKHSTPIDIEKEINLLNTEEINQHKNKIIEYFAQNNISYNDLLEMKQKKFQMKLSKFCDDKKLDGALKNLYKSRYKNHDNNNNEIEPIHTNDKPAGEINIPFPNNWKDEEAFPIKYWHKRSEKKIYVAIRDWHEEKREVKIQWIAPTHYNN